MKSEHRHELKTNELAEWLLNLPQWAHKNRTTIIYTSVAAVIVIVYSLWYYYQKNTASAKQQIQLTKLILQLPQDKRQILQGQSQGVDISYMLIQTADNLQSAARNIKDPLETAFVLIKRADSLRMELHYRPGTVKKEDATAQINRAKAAYTEAIEKAAQAPSLVATAKLGLGLCEEEMGNFAEAQQIYRDIVTDPRFEYTTAAAQAKVRFDSMAQYQQKVVFKAPAKPAITTPSTPQIKLNFPDSNAE